MSSALVVSLVLPGLAAAGASFGAAVLLGRKAAGRQAGSGPTTAPTKAGSPKAGSPKAGSPKAGSPKAGSPKAGAKAARPGAAPQSGSGKTAATQAGKSTAAKSGSGANPTEPADGRRGRWQGLGLVGGPWAGWVTWRLLETGADRFPPPAVMLAVLGAISCALVLAVVAQGAIGTAPPDAARPAPSGRRIARRLGRLWPLAAALAGAACLTAAAHVAPDPAADAAWGPDLTADIAPLLSPDLPGGSGLVAGGVMLGLWGLVCLGAPGRPAPSSGLAPFGSPGITPTRPATAQALDSSLTALAALAGIAWVLELIAPAVLALILAGTRLGWSAALALRQTLSLGRTAGQEPASPPARIGVLADAGVAVRALSLAGPISLGAALILVLPGTLPAVLMALFALAVVPRAQDRASASGALVQRLGAALAVGLLAMALAVVPAGQPLP